MDEADATPPQRGTDEISVLDLALVFAENRRILILVPLAAGLIALAISFAIRPTFTGTTKILLPQQQTGAAAALASQLNTLVGLAGGVGMKNASDTYVAMMKSRTVADRLLTRFGLKAVYQATDDDGARAALASRTSIFAGKDNLIVIATEDHDPKRAADLANAYVDELRNLTQTLAVTEASQRRVFFEGQMKQAKEDLTKAEIALRSSGVSEATLKTVPQSALESLARLKAQITAQEVKLASLRGYMTESNPDVARAQQELAALRFQLSRAEQNDNHKAGPADAEYVTKFRDFKYQETLYELMARQTELAKLDEARDGAIIQVVDAALPPERKSKPRKAMIATVTTLIAFILMVLVVFLKQVLRNARDNAATAGKLARLRAYMRL
jgi:uncharacterized protein involved in exopolysaccharide biosynthesis